jgi:hypothetical protein
VQKAIEEWLIKLLKNKFIKLTISYEGIFIAIARYSVSLKISAKNYLDSSKSSG